MQWRSKRERYEVNNQRLAAGPNNHTAEGAQNGPEAGANSDYDSITR